MGPHFMQQDRWFNAIPGYTDSVIANVERADAVAISMPPYNQEHSRLLWPAVEPRVNHILEQQFTKQQFGRHNIYFRKNN
jgi:hypothetical protein